MWVTRARCPNSTELATLSISAASDASEPKTSSNSSSVASACADRARRRRALAFRRGRLHRQRNVAFAETVPGSEQVVNG